MARSWPAAPHGVIAGTLVTSRATSDGEFADDMAAACRDRCEATMSPSTAANPSTVHPGTSASPRSSNITIEGNARPAIEPYTNPDAKEISNRLQPASAEPTGQLSSEGGSPPPLFFVDVTLAPGQPPERIVLREGQSITEVAATFAAKHVLTPSLAQRLHTVL